MSTTWPIAGAVEERRAALCALDQTVRDALAGAARAWDIRGETAIDLTVYDRVYRRTPRIGGHWTLFRTDLTESVHEVATLTVAVEFEGNRPVDLWVSGARDVVAGGCTSEALSEALIECGGPLRQVTPVAISSCPDLSLSLSYTDRYPAAPSLN